MSDTTTAQPSPRVSLLADIEAEASRHELEAAKIERTMATMTKPGEQSTKRQLDRKMRTLQGIVWQLRNAKRALEGSPL